MKRVLFLCSGNYYRSRFAEELFRYRARRLLPDWAADSRGLSLNPNNPGPISPLVLDRLENLGFSPTGSGRLPSYAEDSDFRDADVVIAMSKKEHLSLVEKKFSAYSQQVEYWDVEDTADMPSEVALAKIEILVDELVQRLKNQDID